MITADMRLDNRDDMLARIGLTPREAISWPDSRILLSAWERFGDAVWPMLRGPFAVAIWNPQNHVLTLARDPLGLNVVMWHRSERFFAFATMPNGLFALDAVRRELSEEKFADFLVLNHAEHATTIYKDIFRVRPAHVMRVEAGGAITQHRYWSPDDVKAGEVSFRSGLCGRTARMPRRGGAAADAQRSSDWLPPQRRSQLVFGRGPCGTRARGEKSAADGLHRGAAARI